MATTQNGNVQRESSVRGGENVERTASNVGSPISNEAYNVISALAAKLEGLEAYRKYAKDGDAAIWKQLTQIETEGVDKLVGELEDLVKSGKLRMKEPGRSNG